MVGLLITSLAGAGGLNDMGHRVTITSNVQTNMYLSSLDNEREVCEGSGEPFG